MSRNTWLACVAIAAILVTGAVWLKLAESSNVREPELEFELRLTNTLNTESVVSSQWGEIFGADCLFVDLEKLDANGAAHFTLHLKLNVPGFGFKETAASFEWRDGKVQVDESHFPDVRDNLTFAFTRFDDRIYAVYAIDASESVNIGQWRRKLICVRDRPAGDSSG